MNAIVLTFGFLRFTAFISTHAKMKIVVLLGGMKRKTRITMLLPLQRVQRGQETAQKALFSNIFLGVEREDGVSRLTFVSLGSHFDRYNMGLTSSKAAIVTRNLGDLSLKELSSRSKVEDKNRSYAKIFTILEASVYSLYDARSMYRRIS